MLFNNSLFQWLKKLTYPALSLLRDYFILQKAVSQVIQPRNQIKKNYFLVYYFVVAAG